MYETLSAMSNLSIAASVSPPPAREKPALAATASDTALVPPANASNSKTPTGPFQRIVPAATSFSAMAAEDWGPMSRIISSSATSAASLISAAADSLNSLATTTSIGSGMWVLSMSARAVSMRSCSHKDLPTGYPAAAKNVLAIPPPTTKLSHLSASCSRTSSLVETLEPPTMASMGRAGSARACSSASNSRASKGPAQAIGAKRPTP